jgi:acyl carrier protein
MPNPTEECCARIFREVVGIAHSVPVTSWNDKRLLTEPLEVIDVDSLTLLDFVMQVESTYTVELDEAEVNSCRTISELAALVVAARQ